MGDPKKGPSLSPMSKDKRINYPIRVLMVSHSGGLTGPNRSSFALATNLDKNKFYISSAFSPVGEFKSWIKNAGIEYFPLGFGLKSDLEILWQLINILRRNEYHILHGRMGRVGPLICLAGRITGVPAVILTEHMNDPEHSWLKDRPVRFFLHNLGHMATNNCLDKVIAVSEEARESYIRRQGIGPAKVVCIHNSVDFSRRTLPDHQRKTTLKKQLGFSEDNLLIGLAGRLIREKGYGDVIIAAREIIGRNPQARFFVAGEGPERESLEALAARNNISGKIKFSGFMDDMDSIMPAFDMLIQPSWSECRESFGNTLIEAMANKAVVCASNVPAFLRITDNGKAGVIFQEKNPGDLAAKVNALINDPAARNDLAEKAYLYCRREFNASNAARRLEKVYQDALLDKGYKLC
ncbi:MAG: glycosyltransferase family 4 protein [Candidatus Omnitrophica bacterium]|nr:glycosyltransferase family 4 protein [Candidatus Omnitrophota bacterium]MDD5080262.1 glycosyltransferase family 4 protein [Candidatus Omnitrophota bacterium]